MLTSKKLSDLPNEIINLMVVMLGCDFHVLVTLNKSVRKQIINDKIGMKYVSFIKRLINHYHYSKNGLDHFLREKHGDPKEKLARRAELEKQQKEKKQQTGKNIEQKEIVFLPIKKRHLDPEDAFDFHSSYHLADKLRKSLYFHDEEYPSAALRLGLDDRYFHGRDYINSPKQMYAVFRLIAGGLSKSQAVECIRGFSSLQARGISWGLSEHAVKTLTVVQLKFLVKVVRVNLLEDVSQLLLRHKELDDEIDLRTLYSIIILNRVNSEIAFQLLTEMPPEQKHRQIWAYRHPAGALSQEQDFVRSNIRQAQPSQVNEVKEEKKLVTEEKVMQTTEVKQDHAAKHQPSQNVQNNAASLIDSSFTRYSVLSQQGATPPCLNRNSFWQLAEQAAELQVRLFDTHEPELESCAFNLF